MDWSCGSIVECLLCKSESLSLNPSPTKKFKLKLKTDKNPKENEKKNYASKMWKNECKSLIPNLKKRN
jgi:hypothetical protein